MALTIRRPIVHDGAMAGTAESVAHALTVDVRESVRDKDVVALYIPKLSKPELDSLVVSLKDAALLLFDNIHRVQELQMAQLIDSLTPRVPPSSASVRKAKMISNARAAVLTRAEWLTAADIAKHSGSRSVNPNAQTSKWKRDGKIFTINPADRIERFPAYALDEDFKPYPAMAEVIKILGERKKDGWGLAYWFASDNSYLGGRIAPQDLLASDPGRVIDAARREAKGIQHG
jgi:hypothetical protein